jgi:lycopene cyclase domain-containing protein
MTYMQILLVFVVAPMVALGAAVLVDRYKKRGQQGLESLWPQIVPLLALTIIATLYTYPWDNHLIAAGVWWYQPALLLGLYIGRVPLEEALFFPLETLLVGVWWLWLARWFAPTGDSLTVQYVHDKPRSAVGRAVVIAVGVAVWIGSLALLGAEWRPGTYAGWELAWALPPLLLQIGVGGNLLWRYRLLLGLVVLPAALYLSCVDALAIHLRIWAIDPRQSLDVSIGGLLPVEELLFFLVTSVLIGIGLALGSAAEKRFRIQALFGSRRSTMTSQTP